MDYSEIDITDMVNKAEKLKTLPSEAQVLMLYSIMKDTDSSMGRWAKILMKYGMDIEKIVPCLLSLHEDLMLSMK